MSNNRTYYSHDAEMHAMRDRTVLSLVFLTFGLGIGTLIALLFAPNSGDKTRKQLIDNAENTLQTGHDAVEPLIKRVEEKFDDFKENVKEHLK